MANFALNAILLLLVAYLMGCIVGCWLRGVMGREEARTTAPEAESAKPAVETAPAGPAPAATAMAETAPSEKPSTAKPSTKPKPERRTSAMSEPAASDADDLKRIKGVGPVIEKKLNDKGVRRYLQIAEWTPADVEDMDKELNFRGRIDRENWISQAKMLAKGADKEFSRRVDKGEVESSKSSK